MANEKKAGEDPDGFLLREIRKFRFPWWLCFPEGFRGAGRLWAALQHVGYEELLGKLILIRLHYPLWYGGDDLIRELNLRCCILQARGGGRTIFVDSSDPD